MEETIKIEKDQEIPKGFTGIAIEPNGSKYWYRNRKLHKDGAPAAIMADGDKHWFQNGLYHRIDGPAIEQADGWKCWYQYGKLHRLDGPAEIWDDGTKEYYILNKKLTENQFQTFQFLWKNSTHKKTKKLMKIFVKLATTLNRN